VKYEDSIERSTELLRMALPIMSRQGAALHPVSYAVWYEYVSKNNAALRRAIDERLERQGALDEASTQALFSQFVAEVDPATAQKLTDGFQRVLAGMAESAAAAGDQTARFGSSLSRLSAELGDTTFGGGVIDQVLQDTQRMQASVQTLQQQLSASQQEIELLRDEVRRARHESLVDSLTGLANRRAFDQRLSSCLAAADADPDAHAPALVMADIDHFKRINDTYGHGFGDQVLCAIAQVLRSTAGEPALAARTGGEEFSLLLPAMSAEEVAALAERVRATVAASRVRRKGANEVLERVTISLGVSRYRRGETTQTFIERADQALYESKKCGRDRVTIVVD
jgi:diguanylate cyclase